ncbi:MAG: hypothetical protein HF973_09645 [Chloroflexi bacterium]|nr:hypothetical protein [Chloroflexota bacterium]
MLIIFFVLAVVFIGFTIQRYANAASMKGKWTVFDSQHYIHGIDNPDGFRVEYPSGWQPGAYDNGGPKNLGDLRARFTEPHFIFTPKTYLSIWWKRIDKSWTLEDVRDWYIEENGFNINRELLEQSRDSFSEITVGADNYPALTQTFAGGTERIVLYLFIVGDEAFVLEFNTKNYNADLEKTFDRMLSSFEVYE